MDCTTTTTVVTQDIIPKKRSLDNIFLNLGEHICKFENVEIGPEDREKAQKELRETPEVVNGALEALRKLIKEEPSFYFPYEDDFKLQIFLRPCKHYPNSAFDRMKKFYKFKHKNPKLCLDLVPNHEKRAFQQSLLTILPYRNKNGERILLIEVGKKWNPKECSLNEIYRSVMIILEAALEEPKTQINGVHVILDTIGLSLQHVWQFTAGFAKNLAEWTQECIPIRLKGVHIVNQPYVFNMVFALFKPFLGRKLQERIIMHGDNYNSLHSYISSSVLPKAYGGDLEIPSDSGPDLHNYLSKFNEEFEERGTYGYGKNLKN